MRIIVLNITYMAAIGLSLYSIGWLLNRGNKNRTTYAFILCQALIILWCVTQFFTGLQLTAFQQTVIYDISYLGICLIGPSWLLFSLFYGERRVSPRLAAAIYAPSAAHYLVLMTNGGHHLFYTSFEAGNVAYGPLFYTNACYIYLCVLGGTAVLYKSLARNPVNRSQVKAVIFSVLIPLICNILYLAGFLAPGFDITPPAFSVTSILLLWATYRYNFLNVNTLASSQVFESVTEGILIYNTAGKITYANEAAADILQVKTGEEAAAFYDRVRRYNEEAAAKPDCDGEALLIMEDGRRVELKRQIHRDRRGRMTAGTVVLSDVSRYYELVERTRELAASNEQLAVERERNRIAQEVHDTTGHTLTMIRSLMKLAGIESGQGDSSNLKEYLEQAEGLASDGIRELRCSINNLKQAGGRELVSSRIRRLAETVKEIEVEVSVQGPDSGRYSHLTDIVYECAREAVTNCLKYAGATHMDIIIKFHDESLDVYIFDNGGGCGKIIPGNGLGGMEKRIREAGGTFRAASAEGEGFQIILKLPVITDTKESTR